MINAVEIVRDLLAEKALGEGMLRIAAQLDRLAVVDGDDDAASVGAIVRADGTDGGQGVLHVHVFYRGYTVTELSLRR